MLRLPVFLALLVLANAQDLLGVDYSFDVDFYRNFDNRKCDRESAWKLVAYKSLDVEPPFINTDKGIQAVGNCCATSFPIYFFNGFLEFNVYVQMISQKFRISIEVFDEYNVPHSRYLYGPSTKGFKKGWQALRLKVNNVGKGYINIRGRSLYDGVVLIDSFRYVPNTTLVNHRYNKRSVSSEKEDDAEILFEFNDHTKSTFNRNQDVYELDDGSGDEANSTPEPGTTDESETEASDESDSFWNPFTIFFVSFGTVVVLVLVAVGAYHCGKVRGRDNVAQPAFAEVNPPRTITIPRVTGVHENRSTSLIFD